MQKETMENQVRMVKKGVENLVNEDGLRRKLQLSEEEGRPLTIKFGMDPSAPDIHLGHTVPLRKIRQMQDMGHEAVVIIGDFTARIGDPTGRSKTRKILSEQEIMDNSITYCDQIFKILDKGKTKVRYNSEWLDGLGFSDAIRLASTTTVARMLEREDFKNRYQGNLPIGVHEFLYPLMQAYDSIHIKADVEIGGTDQTFNILMGRSLQKHKGEEEQVAIFLPILEGLDGVNKMSKSLGNYIGIDESSESMFKKVMEVPDDKMIRYYELVTDVHPDKIRVIREDLANGKNPRDVKLDLAKTITSLYHEEEDLIRAKEYYQTAFAGKGVPDGVPELRITKSQVNVMEAIPVLVEKGYVKSNGEFRRLLSQGGVRMNGEKLNTLNQTIHLGDVMRIGKKRFVRFVI